MRDEGRRAPELRAAEREGHRAFAVIERRVRELADAHRLPHALSAVLERPERHTDAAGIPAPPHLAELERHVDAWRDAVPGSAPARAALARLMAARHPGLAAAAETHGALGLADAGVHRAHQALYGESLRAELARAATPLTRLRLAAARAGRLVDTLPPVPVFAALVVGICIPQALLGLPVVAVAVGPLPAVGVLAVIGLLLTVALMAETESMARSGPFRAGAAFLGRLSDQFLGAKASAITTPVAAARTALSALAAYVGLALSLAALTGIPRPLLAALTLLALAALLLRGGIRISVGAGASVGLVSSVLVIAIAAIAAGHAEGDGLARAEVPLLGGQAPADKTLGPLVALALLFYIGNVYVIGVARRMLARDPGGAVSVKGTALGMAALTVLGALFVVPVTAAVPAGALTAERGTALGPLSDVAGPAVAVLGTLATLLLLGLGLERTAVALQRFVDERLPQGFGATAAGRVSPRAVACAVPALATCAIGELLLSLDAVSFSGVMGLAGVISNIVVSGAVPMLLVLGARRRGELRPRRTIGVLGEPAFVAAATALYAVLLAAFAVALFDTPAERVAAGVATVVLLGVVWRSHRDGAFRPRAVVAIVPAEGGPECRLTVGGRPAELELAAAGDRGEAQARGAAVALPRVGALRSLSIRPRSARPAADLELWLDPALPAGVLPSPMSVTVRGGDEELRRELGPGATVLPLGAGPWEARLEASGVVPAAADG